MDAPAVALAVAAPPFFDTDAVNVSQLKNQGSEIVNMNVLEVI